MYRLPFSDQSGWSVGKGNWDDPIVGHGPGQDYAIDFNHAEGGQVRSARGGIVVVTENNVSINTSQLPDSDPNKKFGAGNYVLIRHIDGTVGAYDHFKKGSVLVQKDNWVAQGQIIASSGNTGNSFAPHVHFDVRAYWNSAQDLGPTIPIVFEDKNHTAWRPRVNDVLSSNNSVHLQEAWSYCNKCQGLFYGGYAGSKCPAIGEHSNIESGNYRLQRNDPNALGQQDWRWCNKCQGLFFGGHPNSKCPASGEHNKTSADYKLIQNSPNAPGQQDWRWCNKCQGLFFGGHPNSKCPASGEHSKTGSGNYVLIQAIMNGVQSDWRHCNKCHGLFFGGNPNSKCPAGGEHSKTGSGNYFLGHNSATYPGQHDWRHCNKCHGLFFGGNPNSKCPAGGEHSKTGSGNYSLIFASNAPGQHVWRWCNKCQGLFFQHTGSKCPAGGAHNSTGSGDYGVMLV